MIRFGYHGITWKDYETAIREIGEVGFKGFETFPDLAFAYDNKREYLKKLMQENGLNLATLYGGGDFVFKEKHKQEIKRNLHVAEFIDDFGGDVLVLGGGMRLPEGDTSEHWRNFFAVVDEIGKIVKSEYGMKACYHPHLGTLVESREEIRRFMEYSNPDWVFMCPDTAHLLKGSSDPVEVFSTYIDRIKYVHFKDINPDAELLEKNIRADEALPIFSELGTGPVDFVSVYEVLTGNNYDGWITIELDQTTKTPQASACISMNYLRETLKVDL